MTESEQVKALAELDGWRLRLKNSQGEQWVKPDGDIVTLWHDSTLHDCNFFTQYLTSYDAIIPLIQKQDGETKNLVEDYIEECQTMKTSFWYDATPSQLCEALLRATGKGKD